MCYYTSIQTKIAYHRYTYIIKAYTQTKRRERTMDIQRRKELAKEKRIERLIRKEEYEEAMNKLPINERAIIKDVLLQIKYANISDKRYERERENVRERQLAKQKAERERNRRERLLKLKQHSFLVAYQ